MDYWVSLFQCYGTEYSLSVPLMTYLAFSTILDIDNHRTDGEKTSISNRNDAGLCRDGHIWVI